MSRGSVVGSAGRTEISALEHFLECSAKPFRPLALALLSELGPVFVIAFPRIDGLAAPGVGSCAGCECQSDQRVGNKLP
jgi:hypothetical protein